jgi:hypothetical protein
MTSYPLAGRNTTMYEHVKLIVSDVWRDVSITVAEVVDVLEAVAVVVLNVIALVAVALSQERHSLALLVLAWVCCAASWPMLRRF